MRAFICAMVAAGLAAQPAFAQDGRAAAPFWKSVQSACDATARKPVSELGHHIAQAAIDEFNHFGGHEIDSDGRIFHFGLTEAEHEEDDGGSAKSSLGRLGWWQVWKYWRALYGDKAASMVEVRGYNDASTSTQDDQSTEVLRPSADDLLRAVDGLSDAPTREVVRESIIRSAIVDTSWSAAFISYVVKQAGVAPDLFQFSNAHRAYIYDAVATSAAEVAKTTDPHIYRACPLGSTKIRVGDMICTQRESKLADMSDADVRERIRGELSGDPAARSIRRTHCEVVAYVDAGARKVYSIGGNVNQAVAVRKMNLRRDLKFSEAQGERCGGPGHWTLPPAAGEKPHVEGKCSLNDKKWFVLLQLR
jgi:hypothetical protein